MTRISSIHILICTLAILLSHRAEAVRKNWLADFQGQYSGVAVQLAIWKYPFTESTSSLQITEAGVTLREPADGKGRIWAQQIGHQRFFKTTLAGKYAKSLCLSIRSYSPISADFYSPELVCIERSTGTVTFLRTRSPDGSWSFGEPMVLQVFYPDRESQPQTAEIESRYLTASKQEPPRQDLLSNLNAWMKREDQPKFKAPFSPAQANVLQNVDVDLRAATPDKIAKGMAALSVALKSGEPETQRLALFALSYFGLVTEAVPLLVEFLLDSPNYSGDLFRTAWFAANTLKSEAEELQDVQTDLMRKFNAGSTDELFTLTGGRIPFEYYGMLKTATKAEMNASRNWTLQHRAALLQALAKGAPASNMTPAEKASLTQDLLTLHSNWIAAAHRQFERLDHAPFVELNASTCAQVLAGTPVTY